MRLARRVALFAGMVIAVAVVGLALIGPWLADDPQRIIGLPYSQPAPGSPLGTDHAGRDVLDQVLAGGRSLLVIPVLATLAATVLGTVLGLLAGYLGGIAAAAIARLDHLLLGLPPVLILLVLLHGWGYTALTVTLGVVLTGAPFVSRVTTAATLKAVQDGYVAQAYAVGDSRTSVLFREILPNVVGPILADFGTRLAIAVTLTAAAGFLGFGPEQPSWGAMISGNVEGLRLTPWGVAVPAICLGVLTVSANLALDRAAARVIR